MISLSVIPGSHGTLPNDSDLIGCRAVARLSADAVALARLQVVGGHMTARR